MLKQRRLSNTETEALRHICNSLMHKARTPSIRELMTLLGYQSPRSAAVLVDRLVRRGILGRRPDGTIQLKKIPPDEESHAQTVDVALVGMVAAGLPVLAEENIVAFIPVSIRLARPPHKYFLLKVRGDSMNRAGINDGDQVLVRQQKTAENGELIVALIDDEATVKEYHNPGNIIVLKPHSSNPKHKPIILSHDFQVQGVVVSTIPSV
jgi:repressor LexA